jgi:hypothetical protein
MGVLRSVKVPFLKQLRKRDSKNRPGAGRPSTGGYFRRHTLHPGLDVLPVVGACRTDYFETHPHTLDTIMGVF